MDRRSALKAGTVIAAPVALSACSGVLDRFPTWKSGQQAVLDLLFKEPAVVGNPWNLSQVLQHLAQSIEFSMQGFPEMKGAAFRAVLGNLGFTVFNARGAMSHGLSEAIPSAPPLVADQPLKVSVQRLLDAMEAFEKWNGPLKPHFAYGELTKTQYERAHLMHLANHWQQFQPKTATA